jgi:hypothetical protein
MAIRTTSGVENFSRKLEKPFAAPVSVNLFFKNFFRKFAPASGFAFRSSNCS